ncbi:MAG: hypothetical protein KKA19_07690 [Candidatus Margulisbacteria bacterium]|nr:hypothetical protein [Candidatus Margulisiibacteriota bacterium]
MKKVLGLCLIILTFIGGAQAASLETIEISKGDSRPIWRESILSFTTTHPEVIKLEKTSKNEIRIYALFPGEAYVHVWDYDKKRTSYKVKVVGKKAPQQSYVKSTSISGHYSAYFKKDDDADYFVNKWMHTHEVSLKFPTFLGRNTTYLRFKQNLTTTNNSVGQVENFYTRFNGQKYNFILGDDIISYSELMAPGLSYQGARWQAYDLFGALDLDIFAGDRGNIHWGEQVRDDTAPSYNVSGGKINWKLNPNFNLQGTYLMSYEKDKEVTGNRLEVRSMGLAYKVDKYLTLLGEGASARRDDAESPASRVQGIWEDQALRLDLTIRDLSAKYETVSNYLDYQGQKGAYLRMRYRPDKTWSCWGAFDGFLKQFPKEYELQDYQAYRNRMSFALHQISFMTPSLTLWRNYGSVSMWEGGTIRFSQINFFSPLLTFYYEFTPSLYQNSSVTASSYHAQRGIFGTSIRPWKIFEFRLESQWEYYDFRSGFKDNPRGGNVIMNLGTFDFPWTRIDTIFSLRYQYRQNSELTTDQSLYSGSVQLRDDIMPGMNWYLRIVGVAQHIRAYKWDEGKYVYDDDKIRSEIAGGVTYIF